MLRNCISWKPGKLYFEDQILTVRKELDQLKSNPATLEKYAREKYLMKRDNEDLVRCKVRLEALKRRRNAPV